MGSDRPPIVDLKTLSQHGKHKIVAGGVIVQVERPERGEAPLFSVIRVEEIKGRVWTDDPSREGKITHRVKPRGQCAF